MKKLSDWEARFHQFLVANRRKPFAWGEWDCCIFTNAAVREMTGEDLIPDELHWTDQVTAMQAIERYGKTLGMSVQKAALAAGLETIDPTNVTKGDVVVVKEEGGQVAGICDGFAILCPSDEGYTYKPIGNAQKVFRIHG
jgi:hypothetical protein